MKQKYIFFIFIFLLFGCDPMDNRLIIVNKSTEPIFYSMSINDVITNNPLRILDSKDTIFEDSYIIPADTFIRHALIGSNEWEYFINRDCIDSTLKLFVFEKQTILNIPWDTITKYRLYKEKYNLTVKGLQKMNWKVVYSSN